MRATAPSSAAPSRADRTGRALALALAAAALLAAPPAADAQYARSEGAFDLEHVFELEYADDPRISPDGERVVYVRTSMDAVRDRRESRLWIVRSDGSDHRPLTDPGVRASSPRWSPDGERVAYVAADGEEGAEVYVRWMDTGATARVTRLERSPGALAWSPDGVRLSFTMFVEEETDPFARMPEPPADAEWAPAPDVIRRTVYRADGRGYLPPGHAQLFVVPASGGTPRQVTRGPWEIEGTPGWTPDGRTLILSARRGEDAALDPGESEVWAVEVATGEATALTDRDGPDAAPAVSPDGRRIAYTGFDDRRQGYQVTRLYVTGRDGTGSHLLTPELDRDVRAPTWSADGRSIYFLYDDGSATKVGRVDLEGELHEVVGGVGGTTIGRPYTSGAFSLARDGRVAYTRATPHRPADVAVARAGGEPRVLTALNEDLFDQAALGEVEAFSYASSHDGREIEGWIVTPPGFDPSRSYPLVLEIHGGPFATYGPYFSAEVQLYASAGYVVLYTNPRGSAGYGAEFGNAIHHAYPGHDYDDLMSGVDAVLERGYVDPDRLYVTGGSGGGVLTAWIVGHTDRFRAAVSAKPVIHWASWALTADMYPYGVRYWFPGPPWEHAAHYMARSPLAHVGSVTTPTMLLTGTEDYRTPMSESEQFYQALRLRGVKSALVRMPGASHHIAERPSQLAAKVAHVLEWFRRHGGPEPDPDARDGGG